MLIADLNPHQITCPKAQIKLSRTGKIMDALGDKLGHLRLWSRVGHALTHRLLACTSPTSHTRH